MTPDRAKAALDGMPPDDTDGNHALWVTGNYETIREALERMGNEWLEEAIERAQEDVADTEPGCHNSYGAGYDQGYLEALKEVRDNAAGEES